MSNTKNDIGERHRERKAPNPPGSDGQESLRCCTDRESRQRKERVFTEAYPESEFNLNPSVANGKSGITVEDLIAPLQGTTGFGSIRKRLQQLQKSGAPVQAPLPKVVQERLDRKAGYQKTREDITKWQPIVKRNREAPTLVFNKQEPAPPLSTASLAAKFMPTTDLEKEMQTLLRESKIAHMKDVEEIEALELNKLTVDEVQERQKRLAKMRNLLFRHEAKAKRVKKIKSKTFHRLLQKDQKSKAVINAAVSEADPETAKAMVLKKEFNRAQERMTLKHKNSTRWAKRILKRGHKGSDNDGKRDAIAEQLRTHAELTRKIHSATLSDSDESSSESEEEEDSVPGLVLERKSRSNIIKKAKVATLKALDDGDDNDVPASGLLALPFMARAMEKRRKLAQDEAMAMLEQLEQSDEDKDDFLRNDAIPPRKVSDGCDKIVDNGKILSIGVETVPTEPVSLIVPGKKASQKKSPKLAQGKSTVMLECAQTVPLIVPGDKPSQKEVFKLAQDETVVTNQSVSLIAPGKKLSQKKVSKLAQDKPIVLLVPTLPVSPIGPGKKLSQKKASKLVQDKPIVKLAPSQPVPPIVPGKKPSQKKAWKLAQDEPVMIVEQLEQVEDKEKNYFSDDDNDDNVHGVELLDASSSQQELIRQAFAGDNVEAEFENSKAQIFDEEVPVGEATVSLPGWGQWTHVQQKKGQPAWLLKEQEILKSKRDTTLGKRKDTNLKHVIISEKLDKKASKFSAARVPFPFSSRDLYERSIRLPIGRDYNTDKAYQDMIRPAVIKSAGVIIDPIKADKFSMNEVEPSGHIAKKKRGK